MKTSLASPLRHAVWLLLVLALSVITGQAQTSQFMTYQGYLTDGNGNALGNTNSGPTSYSVVFRIWNLPTGGVTNGPNELWAELQTVTVDKGYFSLLLGQGTAYNTEPRGQLASVFTNSATYIEMTVLGIGPSGGYITLLPRLQFVYSPYAFSAANATAANTLINNGGTPLLTSSGTSLNLPNQLNAASVQVSNSVSVSGLITTTDGPNGPGGIYINSTNGFHQSSLGAFNVDAPNILGGRFTIKTNGYVGIGTSTPGAPLDVQGLTQVNTNGTVESLGTKNTYDGMIETYYSGPTDRYGMGQFPNGVTALFTSAAYSPGSIQFGLAGSNSFSSLMTVTHGGSVGIGTTIPAATLEVNGGAQIDNSLIVLGTNFLLGVNGGSGGYTTLGFALSQVSGGYATIQATKTSGGYWGNLCLNPNSDGVSGLVGIGTTSPSKALLEIDGTGSSSVNASTYEYINSTTSGHGGPQGYAYSLYTSGDYWCGGEVDVTSDARTKSIAGRSASAQDLQTLKQIQITDYHFIDTVEKGGKPFKKVIAQQVEKVFPQAVSTNTGVVPDIYKTATIKDGWVNLATDLKIGDRVRLIGAKDKGVHEVLEIRPGAFRPDYSPADKQIFVYGREVKDFRSVDYDAIAMLNVSATQELAKRQETQEHEIADLKQQIADLKHLVVAMAETAKNSKQAAGNDQTSPGQTPVTASLDR